MPSCIALAPDAWSEVAALPSKVPHGAVSFFERFNNAYFNSVAIIDADGRRLGTYRKSHIPTGVPHVHLNLLPKWLTLHLRHPPCLSPVLHSTKRKAHVERVRVASGPGYQEKFFFSPGDTGFKVFSTAYGCIGVAICWDQVGLLAFATAQPQAAQVLLTTWCT